MDPSLLARVRKAAAALMGATSIFLAYVYGSRFVGRPRPNSDLDLGFYRFPKCEAWPRTLKDELVLEAKLAQRIGLEVDLRNLAEASLEFRGKVLEEGVRVYVSDEAARVNLERSLLSLYHDQKVVLEEFHRLRTRALAR